MIVILEGKYASRNTVADMRYRIINSRAAFLFVERQRRISPDTSKQIEIFHQHALVPSFAQYANKYPTNYVIDLSHPYPSGWSVSLSKGNEIDLTIDTNLKNDKFIFCSV